MTFKQRLLKLDHHIQAHILPMMPAILYMLFMAICIAMIVFGPDEGGAMLQYEAREYEINY